jgi:hypothetical protein
MLFMHLKLDTVGIVALVLVSNTSLLALIASNLKGNLIRL